MHPAYFINVSLNAKTQRDTLIVSTVGAKFLNKTKEHNILDACDFTRRSFIQNIRFIGVTAHASLTPVWYCIVTQLLKDCLGKWC